MRSTTSIAYVRRLATLLATVTIVSTLSADPIHDRATAAAPAVPAKQPVRVAPDLVSASRAARQQGYRVEVANMRSEHRTVFAEPGGSSMAEISAVPVRARKGSAWVGVDTTLARRADGMVAPRAAAVDLAFSGGGTAPMVVFGRSGTRITLTWPGRLPAPRLAGAKATYANVRPGIDLVLRAERTGYTQHLVVKTAAAARALTQLRLGLRTHGLRVTVTKAGGLEARDVRNAVVFFAPPSAMWDSGNLRSLAKVSTTSTALTLIPDQRLLRNPRAKFPIIVDPNWQTYGRTFWTSVSSGHSGTAYPNSSPAGADIAQVGLCAFDGCAGIGTMRSYFQFDTGWIGLLVGKRIMGVWLDSATIHSPNCTDQWHHLHRAGWIDGGTRWNNQPLWGHIASSLAPRAYANGGCGGWKLFSFGLPTDQINVHGASTYAILAGHEGESVRWRKYDPHATKLRIRFNAAPNTPTGVHSDPGVPGACANCAGKRYLGGSSMRLIAGLSDPDGNAVHPEWHIYGDAGNPEVRFGSGQVNGTHDTTIGLTDGKEMDWYVRGWDVDEDNGARLDASGWVRGPGAPFVVDRTAPSSAPKVTGLLYKEDNRWHGGVGVPGRFILERTKLTGTDPGTADVDHYLWGTHFPPTTKAVANGLGGPAVIDFEPTVDGPQDIFVQSVDRAGNKSPSTTMHIYVRPGNGPYAQWSLDGNVDDEAYLGDRDGTLAGGATYTPGAVGSAVRLDGQRTSMVTAPNAITTDASFTVSAWVKLDRAPPTTHTYTALSQDGSSVSGLFLGYRRLETGDHWEFYKPARDDVNDGGGWALRSTVPAHTKTWTHLSAVYDAEARQLRLYVNGAQAGVIDNVTEGFDATGEFRIGTSKWGGALGANPWPGLVDEVKVFDRALDAGEARALVGRDNVHAGHWSFEETAGSTARNRADDGESMVLHDGAEFTGPTGGVIGGALRLDEGDDYAASTGPVLHTNQSFTVASWVNATAEPAGAGNHRTAISAEGNVNSAFFLGYRDLAGGDKWEFHATSADAVSPRPADALVRSDVTAAINTPTHLAAVYDAPNKEIRLYVNGKFAGKAAHANGFDATGPLTIGRGRWENVQTNQWAGVVDEVRAYSRDLSEAEIQGIVARSNVTAGSWKLDGNAGDSAGTGHGTLNGAPDWTGGQTNVPAPTDLAVRLNGSTQYVTAPHGFDPTKSFAVTAWARLDGGSALRTVLSQDGNQNSAFKVRVAPDGRWSFVMFAADAAEGGGGRAEIFGGKAQAGVWTHLAAMYDASARQISLYVNGVLAGTKPHTQSWNHAAGLLQFGRARWNTTYQEYWPGAIDDVTAYNRVLFADEITTMAGRDLSLAHNWALDEASGSNAADGVGARAGAIDGATHVPGKLGNALRFDGTNDVVSTEGVDIDTSQSFTVASWVKLRRICDRGSEFSCKLTAVSMDGGQPSKFRLGHIVDDDNNQLGAWIFELPEADGSVTKASVSAVSSDLDRWVHLAGVYDARAKQIWLYVNGTRQDDGTLDTPWAASGGLQLGRGRVAGTAAEFWDGEIDDVRLYAGDLDKARIESLVASYPVQGGGSATLPAADAGHWRFDEGSGTSVADISGRGLTATLRGGAGWTGGRNNGGAWLDGVDDFAETAGPALDTTRSFSASAWVYLTGTTTNHRTVIAQDGSTSSSFLLQYQDETKKWAVLVPGTSGAALGSTELAARDEWTHLAVVYDAGLRQLRLYVQGVLSAAQTGVTVSASSGPFTIGRAKWNGGNTDHFARGVDDVRAYGRALTDGEVRAVHDDMMPAMLDHYRFDDGTGRDYGWRNNPGTASGGASYVEGTYWKGKALQLDGSTGSMQTAYRAVVMADSFTVSAWARLSRKDKVGTVLGQDGQRRSGFVLQYRPGLDRWVFGGPSLDLEGDAAVYATSTRSPALHQWTHLGGVYDHSAGEFRLYVDGELAGTRKGVRLANANGAFSIGRGRYDGKPVDFFPGAIDEVRTEHGVHSATELAIRGGWPAPRAGQLGRYLNLAGDHYTDSTDKPVRPGYRFESTLGRLAADGPNTRVLYACQVGADAFTSMLPDCEGKTVLGEIGRVYTVQPTNLATIPIYRCNTGPDHFESRHQTCEGVTNEMVLGYTVASAPLMRHVSRDNHDHWTTVHGTPPSYRQEGLMGWLPLTSQTGTSPLVSCLDDVDEFTSLDLNCEGKTYVSTLGYIYTAAPEGQSTVPIYRCLINGQRFVSRSASCEGLTVDRLLGYLPTDPPATAPSF